MRSRTILLIIGGLFGFNILHALLSELQFFTNNGRAIMPLIGGLSPASIYSDSLSTRNPALEAFYAILSDLPGAYTFYLSPIFISPIFRSGYVNGLKIPNWTNYPSSGLGASELDIFTPIILGVVLVSVVYLIIFRRRK
jgi:hypothetical protein